MWAPIACTRPMVVVLFPSPRGVGVMLESQHYCQDSKKLVNNIEFCITFIIKLFKLQCSVFSKLDSLQIYTKVQRDLPCDNNIFSVWLGLQALYDTQLDLGLCGAKELHFIR